jgi:hypothetical protein
MPKKTPPQNNENHRNLNYTRKDQVQKHILPISSDIFVLVLL